MRASLPAYAQTYWDKHIHYFSGRGLRKSFYYRGASGALAWMCRNYIQWRRSIRTNVEQLLRSENLREQMQSYGTLEQKIFNPFISRLLNSHFTMCLAGVPKAQQALMQEQFAGGNVAYIQHCFRHIFTELEVRDNYFYHVYLKGNYTPQCCPEYLKKEHFSKLASHQDRVQTHTTTLSQFLQQNPGAYTHYVLLDHQDWLAAHDVPALEEEWRLLLKNSRPGTKILMRSAASTIDFFPTFVKSRVAFDESRIGAHAVFAVYGRYATFV
ncbi:MAG: DUF3419 family protein, partial [Bacteroidota bacterium]